MEAMLLGMFMNAACVAVFALEHPGSPLRRQLTSSLIRRVIIGVLMGLTAIALIYSPYGQRSGAHMNPGITITFLVLGKIAAWDAVFYILAQFAGGLAGVGVSAAVLRSAIRHESVKYVVTEPGKPGVAVAWGAEFAISFAMMGIVLVTSNDARAAPYTGIFAGILVAAFIAVEAPLSGMSLNPARTLASAMPARSFRGLWIYFTAPPLAMLAAAGLYTAGARQVYCAKLNHSGHDACIFNCRIDELKRGNRPVAAGIQEQPADRSTAR